MTNTSQWVGVVVASLMLSGASIAAYVDIKSDIAVIESRLISVKESETKLDEYDRFLQKQIDMASDNIIRIEAQQQYVVSTQVRLEQVMDKILVEMKSMNENVIRLTK